MTERARALAYVRGLVAKYRDGFPRVPRYQEAFYRNRVTALNRDLELMQAESDEGAAIARAWCLVAGV